jgi:hypothetical protein
MLTVGLMVASSCQKYEEGPAISFKSRKERVANTWAVEKAYEDGKDITADYDQYELQMLTSGYAKLVALYTLGSAQFEYETEGTWKLENKDEDLRLDFADDDADRTYQILRLKEDQLWLKEKGGSVELRLSPKK